MDHLAFMPSEISRLKGRVVEVHPWEVLKRRLRARPIRYLVIAEMATPEGQPLLGPEGRRLIFEKYEPRVRFGEEGATSNPGWWHGNRQTIHVLERRRRPYTGG